ncbi:MAG: hypothetical protein LUC32_00235 [Clostridiales bacterium]|nr:hypothetical protein [Clostridiales bacterium]
MKYLKKATALLLAMILMVAASFNVCAAEITEGTTSVTVYFSFSEVDSIQGTLSYDSSGIITGAEFVTSGFPSGMSPMASGSSISVSSDGNLYSGSIPVKLTISSSAKAGDSATISFAYKTYYNYGNDVKENTTATQTVTVVASSSSSSGSGTSSGGSSSGSSSSSSASSSSSSSSSSTKTEVTEGESIDYTELNKQISIAEGLTQSDYTNDSWEAMLEALNAAYGQQKGTSQTKVDAAAADLEEAIAALVEIDYSELEAAIAAAEELRDSDELGQLWAELLSELVDAADLLTSGDQEAVDAAAASLRSLIEQIEEKMDELSEPEEVVKEVEVEVLPEGRYCNIPIHKVWPILFFISLALNAFFIIMQLYVTKKKKKDEEDDTPTVEYNADDDL